MIPNWHSYRVSGKPDWAPKRLVWAGAETPGGDTGEGEKKEAKEGNKPAEGKAASNTPAKTEENAAEKAPKTQEAGKEKKEQKEQTPVQQLKEELGKLDGDIASKLQKAEELLDKVESSSVDEKVKTKLRSTINSKLSEIQKGNKDIDESVRFNINRLQLKMAQKEKKLIGKLKYLFNSVAILLPAFKDFMSFDPEKMEKAAEKLGDYGNMVIAAVKGKGEIGGAKKIDKNAQKEEEAELPELSTNLSKNVAEVADKVSVGSKGSLKYKAREDVNAFDVKWDGSEVKNGPKTITDSYKEDPLVKYLRQHKPHAENLFSKLAVKDDGQKAIVMNAFIKLQKQEKNDHADDPQDLLALTVKNWDKYLAQGGNGDLTESQLLTKLTSLKNNKEMGVIREIDQPLKTQEKKPAKKEQEAPRKEEAKEK